MRGGWTFVARTIALTLIAGAALAATSHWTLVDLGTLGGPGSYGAAISQGGAVVGCADRADGTAHAFLYLDGKMRDLDAGSNSPGSSCALAVNDSGLVAGRSASGVLVIWSGSSVTSLNVAGDVGGIDSRGVVVGSWRDGASTIAFRYADGALQAIAGPDSVATGINSRGQIAGTVDGRAFIYEGGTLRDLGTLGGARSSAKGLNDLGQVVGVSSDAISQPRAFEFDGAMRALPGPSYAGAIGINNRGQVVGSAEGTHGYLIEGETYTRLDTLGAVTAKGWRRMEPTGINDHGWIVGTGSNGAGELRAFLLIPGDRAPVGAVARAGRVAF